MVAVPTGTPRVEDTEVTAVCTNRHKGHLDVMGPPNSYGNTQRMTLPVLKMRKLSSEKLSHFSEATQQESGREFDPRGHGPQSPHFFHQVLQSKQTLLKGETCEKVEMKGSHFSCPWAEIC